METMTAAPPLLADCAQVEHAAHIAEAEYVVGADGNWLSTTEAAAIIGCSKTHVINLVKRGDLPATRVGNRRRILRTVAEAYRDRMRAEAEGRN